MKIINGEHCNCETSYKNNKLNELNLFRTFSHYSFNYYISLARNE